MAANQRNTEVENSGNLGSSNLIMEILQQLVQENQALNNKVGVIETQMDAIRMQMTEMMGVLQTLKNGTTTEATAVVNPGGAATIHPTSGPAEALTAIPHPESGVKHPTHALGGADPHEVSLFNVGGYPQGYQFENSQPRDRYDLLEERLRAIEDSKTRAKDAHDICLVPDLVIPPKMKVPVFDQYRGTGCPSSHLTMYVRKMAAYANDDKVLIHYFQDSLAGASLNWYMRLQSSDIHSWKDLSEAFLRQYQYNMDMAPDRFQLQYMSKKNDESFREYAQRWRGLAAQVEPPLTEKEMVSMFMETLPAVFYERLIGSGPTSFSDLIKVGERIEVGIKRGRIPCNPAGANNASDLPTKTNGEINAITGQKKSPKYDPIPMSYTSLCSYLISHGLISPREMKPVQPPFPRGYDPKATCEFHAGAIGHTAEKCYLLKHLVQGLIDSKQLTFDEGGEGLNPLRSGLSGRDGNS